MTEQPGLAPMDRYNTDLVQNVHPGDWRNPEPADVYNLVVIGGGTAGLVTAAGAAGLGAKVALVERHLLGGDCLNVGCVPSKCLIRSSRACAELRDSARFGPKAAQEAIDAGFPAAMERLRRIRSEISAHDSAARFRELGVDVFLGEGRFASADTVAVDGVELRFRKAVIATGARAVDPDVVGLADAGFLTNETVFNLTELPRRLAVFGAGPIGCELAQAFRRFGAEVTIFEKHDRLLSREDPDAAALLAEAFRREGIEVLTGADVHRVDPCPDGKCVRAAFGGGEHAVKADEILAGAGRAPNVEGMGLEAVGVDYDARDGVKVDDRLRTTNRRIYAAGDCCMRYKFTHTADFAARIVIQNALFFGRKKLSALVVPWCTYTSPEIAHVGMYEEDARERGIAVDTFTRSLADVDRAVADGETDGFVKVHVKRGTGRILGATIVAAHAGEMISEVTTAIVAGVGLGRLAGVIHPYPTQAEAIRQLADEYNRTRLTPRVKGLFGAWLKWLR